MEKGLSLGTSPVVRARALNGIGWIAIFQGDFESAKTLLEESLTLYRELRDEEGIASSLNFLGYVALLGNRENIPVATVLEEAVTLKPRLQNRRTIANTLIFAGLAAGLLRGDWGEAVALHEEALAHHREMGDTWGTTTCLINLGLMAVALEDHTRGTALLRELMHLSQELGDRLAASTPSLGWPA